MSQRSSKSRERRMRRALKRGVYVDPLITREDGFRGQRLGVDSHVERARRAPKTTTRRAPE